jgi:hypothetical protein
MANRRFKTVRTQAVPYTDLLADALCRGRELCLNTSGVARDFDGRLDEDRARSAWQAHRAEVLDFAARERPGREIWARRFDG